MPLFADAVFPLGAPLSDLLRVNFVEASELLPIHEQSMCKSSKPRPGPKTTEEWLQRMTYHTGLRETPPLSSADDDALRPEKSLTMQDIGFGYMATAPSSRVFKAATPEDACFGGDLVACAMMTWMREARAEATLLYDCTIVCQQMNESRAVNASSNASCSEESTPLVDVGASALRRYAPFGYDPPGFLAASVRSTGHPSGHRPHANSSGAQPSASASSSREPRGRHGGHHARSYAAIRLHLRCYWGLIRAQFTGAEAIHHNYLKGSALLAAMLDTMPRKRFYCKIDTDTVIYPRRLVGFLNGLRSVARADEKVYFGT